MIGHVERLRASERSAHSGREWNWKVTPKPIKFLTSRPHLLLPLGFDEVLFVRTNRGVPLEHVPTELPKDPGFAFERELFFREDTGGMWVWLEGVGCFDFELPIGKRRFDDRPFLHFVVGESSLCDWPTRTAGDGQIAKHKSVTVDLWLARLKHLQEHPDKLSRKMILPTLWTPQAQANQMRALSDSVVPLMQEIAESKATMQDIAPRELEEMIAELLRAKGLQVHVTPRTRDGGRDVIARGELIPGEPMLVAVEAKAKPVVGIADVQRAIQANHRFPALLVATTGRFSAGVLEERVAEQRQLRLFLKDGVAVHQWLRTWRGSRQ